MPAPTSLTEEQVSQPQASAVQNGGGNAGLNTSVSRGMNNEIQGSTFGKTIGEGVGDKNIVEEIGQSPLAASAGGKINAFEGLQTATVAPPMEGKMINTAVNVGISSKQSQGQGQ